MKKIALKQIEVGISSGNTAALPNFKTINGEVITGDGDILVGSTQTLPANAITITNYGGITATNADAALHELDQTKASLDSLTTKADLVNGLIPLEQIAPALQGGLNLIGFASMATALPAASNYLSGQFFIASTAGTGGTASTYQVNDWAVSDGTNWNIVPNASALSSINGIAPIGAVVLTKSVFPDLKNVDNTTDLNKPVSLAVDLAKQNKLVDDVTKTLPTDVSNIKTVNGRSILGEGDLTFPTIPTFKTINGEVITGAGDIVLSPSGALPDLKTINNQLITGTGNLTFTADSISVTPFGGIASTNASAALHELDQTKASLDSLATKADLVNGLIPLEQIAPALQGGLKLIGFASMATTLPAASDYLAGQFFIASTAGTGGTASTYQVNDWAVSDGTNWNIVPNASALSSINGIAPIGAVVLTKSAFPDLNNVDNTTDLNKPVSLAVDLAKQNKLVDDVTKTLPADISNIKTVNGQSIIGEGNLTVAAIAVLAKTYNFVGLLTTKLGTARWYPDRAFSLKSAYLSVGTKSTATDIIVNVSKNGTSLFSIRLLADSFKSAVSTFNHPILITDFLTVDIIATGGSDAALTITYQ